MKLVVQRVSKASVSAENNIVGEIGRGLFILLGISNEDTEKDVEAMVEKVCKLRIMSDENDKMNLSIMDTTKNILVVSQFTLFADTSKGNRPSFIKAGSPEHANKLFKLFISKLKDKGVNVATGKFGAYMQIDATLDGPVTILTGIRD